MSGPAAQEAAPAAEPISSAKILAEPKTLRRRDGLKLRKVQDHLSVKMDSLGIED